MKAKFRRVALQIGNKELYELAWHKCYLSMPKWKKDALNEGDGKISSQLAKEVISLAEKQGFVKELIDDDV